MSNRKKTMRTKLPKPSAPDAIAAIAKLAEHDNDVIVPTHLNRRQLRSMRRRVPVMQVLQPALDWAAKQPGHEHNPSCSHYVPES